MFETFYLQTIFNSPVFILKKELLLIPIFGWYLKKIGSISIKRNKVTKDNLGFFEDISKITLNSKRPLIIFPQGTRVLPHERPEFKRCRENLRRIENFLSTYCYQLRICLAEKGPKKSNNSITVSILEPIKAGIEKNEFKEILKKRIYSELDILN